MEISRDTSIADSTDSIETLEVSCDSEMDIEASVHVSEETVVEIQDAYDEIELEGSLDTTEHVSLDNNITTDESESIKKSKSIRK